MEAIIENGIIVNRIVGHIDGSYPIIDNPIEYDVTKEVMTKEEVIDDINQVVNVVYTVRAKTQEELIADFKAIVPQTITPRQARLILLQYELLDDIEELIKTNRAISIWWEYSLDIQRNDERLLEFATIAGIAPEQLDGMFLDGSKL